MSALVPVNLFVNQRYNIPKIIGTSKAIAIRHSKLATVIQFGVRQPGPIETLKGVSAEDIKKFFR